MREFWKNVLINVIVGLAASVLAMWWLGAFSAETFRDTVRLVCDGFFLVAALTLAYGGLIWTYNGGVMDGLGFSVKTLIARVSRDYEQNRVTFAEYREKREQKSRSPKATLVSGVFLMIPALITFAVYNSL